jgi:hypothetical protein
MCWAATNGNQGALPDYTSGLHVAFYASMGLMALAAVFSATRATPSAERDAVRRAPAESDGQRHQPSTYSPTCLARSAAVNQSRSILCARSLADRCTIATASSEGRANHRIGPDGAPRSPDDADRGCGADEGPRRA